MLIMAGMNRRNRQASPGRTQNGGKEAASMAVRKDKREEDKREDSGKRPGKHTGKDAAPRLPLGEAIIPHPTSHRQPAALNRGISPIAARDEARRGPHAG